MSDDNLTIEYLRKKFDILKVKHFNIINSYIMGQVKITDIEAFGRDLNKFRDQLYKIEITDEILLEVAKMKSQVQHFNTEIMEDEDVLKMAYANLK